MIINRISSGVKFGMAKWSQNVLDMAKRSREYLNTHPDADLGLQFAKDFRNASKVINTGNNDTEIDIKDEYLDREHRMLKAVVTHKPQFGLQTSKNLDKYKKPRFVSYNKIYFSQCEDDKNIAFQDVIEQISRYLNKSDLKNLENYLQGNNTISEVKPGKGDIRKRQKTNKIWNSLNM